MKRLLSLIAIVSVALSSFADPIDSVLPAPGGGSGPLPVTPISAPPGAFWATNFPLRPHMADHWDVSSSVVPFNEVPFDQNVDTTWLEYLGDIYNYATMFDYWRQGDPLGAGQGTQVGGPGAVTYGPGTYAAGEGSTAVGAWAAATAPGATALGNLLTVAAGNDSTALGKGATASADQSVQIGEGINEAAGSLQFRAFPLVDERGQIIPERLPVGHLRNVAAETVSAWTNGAVVVSNDTLSVEVMTAAGPTSIWTSAEDKAAEIASIREQLTALAGRLAALEAGGGASSWNQWAADGTANPEPEYMTMLNNPATMFASGFSWQSSGAFAVLTQSGTVAYATEGGSGSFRIGPNAGSFFGFETGGTIVVGARCNSLRILGDGPDAVAEMAYDYTGTGSGDDWPVLWYTPKIGVDFAVQEGIVWEARPAEGIAVARAPAGGNSGFWFATTTRTIETVFRATMPARLDAGIFGATNALPVVYDSTVTITGEDGRRYRIPAEGVQ